MLRGDDVDNENGRLSWQFLTAVGMICIAVSGGAVWLGSLSKQIAINTSRLDRIEIFADEVRAHDANTSARIGPIEERLDHLEQWQNAVKSGLTHP